MALATQLQSQGRLHEAERLLRQILQRQPHHPFALHLLGVIAYQCGQHRMAAELIQRAIALSGDVALFHANLSEILRQLKQLDKAVAHGERAVALEHRMAMGHGNLGIAWFDRREYDRAEAFLRQALALEPGFAPSLNNMGNICRERGQHEAALDWYRKAIAANPHYLEALNNLGALLLEEDRIPEATETLKKVLRLHPDYAEAVCNMGGVHLAQGKYDAALASYQRALSLRPVYVEAQMGVAKTLQAMERLEEAEAAARRALQFDASNPKAHALLAAIHAEMSEPAAAGYERALELNPRCDDALLGLGHLCVENGQLERAEELFRRALSPKPDNLAARIHLAQAKKTASGDENFSVLREYENNMPGYSDNRRMSLHFALGKCYDDLKEYDKAFPHFLAGCKLKRARLEYDPESVAKQFADSILKCNA